VRKSIVVIFMAGIKRQQWEEAYGRNRRGTMRELLGTSVSPQRAASSDEVGFSAVHRRVASSNLARGTKSFISNDLNFFEARISAD
jgi:hypothetical protein